MKTLSGTFKIFLIVAVMLTGFFCWRAFAKPDAISGSPVIRKWNAKKLKPEYQDDTGAKFTALLTANRAIYCVKFRKKDNDDGTPYDNGGCKTLATTSVDSATRELVLICGGAHVTQQAGFSSVQDAQTVDGAFQ
jgi:hypothetical protein